MLPKDMQRRAVAASAAIYRVSDIPMFDAVLKFELRRRSLDAMTGIAGFGVSSEWGAASAHEGVQKHIVAIQELIRFGRDLGWIAEANAERILEAYERLQDDATLLLREMGNSRDGEGKRRDISEKPEIAPDALRFNSRQDRILVYLRGEGQAPISQICSLFSDAVSEKTIQRDLNELVSSGLIQRRGDNRWTTYLAIGHKMSDREI